MFRSQLSLFIAPSAGRMAVTLSPGSAPSPTMLHSGPFNPPVFPLSFSSPRPTLFQSCARSPPARPTPSRCRPRSPHGSGHGSQRGCGTNYR